MNQPKIDDEGADFYRTPRRMPDRSLPMRRFDVRPRDIEPDATPGDRLLGWIAAVLIGCYLVYCGLHYVLAPFPG